MTTYGLIGYPLGHSFSRDFFTQKFTHENIKACYLNFAAPSIEEAIATLKQQTQLKGFNVTIPYKQAILPFLAEMDATAKAIQAVNVVKIVEEKGEQKWIGYNSDCIGFTNAITPLLKTHHQKALILGTGGASKAIIYALEQLGIHCQQVSRRASEGILSYEQLSSAIINEHTVVVNCTPLGTHPNITTCPDLPYQHLTDKHLLFDLVYNPATTLFMQKGLAQGATVKNGLEMLEGQAIAAWEIWNS